MRWYQKVSASDITERSQLMDEILEMVGTERTVEELRKLHQILKGMEVTPETPLQSREPEESPQEAQEPLYEIGTGEDIIRTRQGPRKSRTPILPYKRRYGPWTPQEVIEYTRDPLDPTEYVRPRPPTGDPRRDLEIEERWKRTPRGQQASKKEAFVPGPYKEDQNVLLRNFPEVVQEALDPTTGRPGVIPSPFASEKPGASDPKPIDRPRINPDLRVNPKSKQKGRLLRRRPGPDLTQTPKMPFGGGSATTRPAGDGHG